MTTEQIVCAKEKSRCFRRDVLTALYEIQTGHPGGSLSVCEILASLYLYEANISPENWQDPKRDKIILCKGHAAPMLYRILAEAGFFPKEELKTLRQLGSRLQGHPCAKTTPGVEISTGPLGIGYPAALGIALGDRLDNIEATTYAILGDGEINEGVVWETCMNAVKYNAYNLITIVDWNRVQLDGTTEQIMPMLHLQERFESFGYGVIVCDGHDYLSLENAFQAAKGQREKPYVILARTVKGKGVSFMEGKSMWHGKAISKQEYTAAIQELGGMTGV